MKYRSFIFDLYGTLADVHTDEDRLSLWTEMAAMYAAWGADYTPACLRAAFRKKDREERRALGKRLGTPWPEIRLEKVFARLLSEAPKTHAVSTPVGPLAGEEAILLSGWADYTANLFRTLSRDRLRLYPGVADTLSALRGDGKKLYLLSNAQAVFTRPEIELLGLDAFFDGMFLSSDLQRMKPDPVFMEQLLEKYGLDRSGSVMVGNDFASDAHAALRCGVDCVILNTARKSAKELSALAAETLRRCPGAPREALRCVSSVRQLI